MKYLVLFLLICSTGFAGQETQKYVVEKPDGSIAIVHYLSGSARGLESILEEQGLSNLPVYQLADSEFKKLDRADRPYWKKLGNKVVVDTDKKLEALNAETAEQEAKDAVLAKLKITEEEADVLKGVMDGN